MANIADTTARNQGLPESQDPGLPYGVSENDIGGRPGSIDADRLYDLLIGKIRLHADSIADTLLGGGNVWPLVADQLERYVDEAKSEARQ